MKISSAIRCAPNADPSPRKAISPHFADLATAWSVFFILLATYWLTVPPTVSYWDCPEYVTAAYTLEIGHPPGNPVWMLVGRIVTMLAPGPQYAALAINLSSGLFTAFAAFFLARTIFAAAIYIFRRKRRHPNSLTFQAAAAAFCGSLAFGWSDSAWFSAVEAEVYAMSVFMTSLCLWLMVKWSATPEGPAAWRLLVLIAYLFGLSIGIHQLNLLCIPALAMIWGMKRDIRSPGKLLLIFFLSLAAVGLILLGMMPSSIALASMFELFAVDSLGLPFLSGIWLYLAILGLSLLLALWVTARSRRRALLAAGVFPAIFMSGLFIFGTHFFAGAVVSAFAALLLVLPKTFVARRLNLCMWMLTMLLAGYSAYALIPIRGDIPSPSNAAMPGNPFSFAAYQAREQYPSNPLFYGQTPYSRPMYEEELDGQPCSLDSKPRYVRYRLAKGTPTIRPFEKAASPGKLSMLAGEDSLRILSLRESGGKGYVVTGHRLAPVLTPELNAFLPRITSRDPADLESYRSWIGMEPSTMDSVRVSETFDSLGNPVAKIGPDGKRHPAISFRPTPLQHAQWFAAYQAGYMYMRYLMWNFSGRQNDIPSQGEVQHGNFITGFPAIDNAMLGADDMLPPDAGKDNPGRNRYFLLPLLLGLAGIFRLLRAGRRGKQVCGVVAVLFVMTGLAIVVYLNQGPGEARERDYSFLGSFLAYAIWIGFGALAIVRAIPSRWGVVIPLAIVGWMLYENADDHDRSDRTAASVITSNILRSLEPDAILIVDGDNYTFPFWYAIEVEGVRPDVRIINLAYLQLPDYAANLMKDWRNSPRLATTLQRGDIIWGRYQYSQIAPDARDTLDAVEALRRFHANPDAGFPAPYLRFNSQDSSGSSLASISPLSPLLPDSSSVNTVLRAQARSGESPLFPAKNLSRSGASRQIDFSRLMLFDIVATNAASSRPRPIYWLRTIRSDGHIRLADFSDEWLYGGRFADPGSTTDSMLLREASFVRTPNPIGSEPYMDRTPARQVAGQRWALIRLAKRLLRNGNLPEADRIARLADLPMGEARSSYGNFRQGDSLINARTELGELLLDLADSIERADSSQIRPGQLQRLRRLAPELRARGQILLQREEAQKEAWRAYRRALPPRLRPKMAPTE